MNDTFAPCADELIGRNAEFAASFPYADVAVEPARQLAIVTCMDARIDVARMLGFELGDAHVIRNAGGVVTDDVIRSLMLSQRALGTREIILAHHTRCGLSTVTEPELYAELEREVGVKPSFALEAFDDAAADVVQSIQRLRRSPFIVHDDHIRGFVYDVDTGKLAEVRQDQ